MEKKKKAVLLTGDRIGRWTLLEQLPDKKWLCRCDCGTQRPVLERSLRSGGSTNCGCQRKGRTGENITGRKIGRLTALQPLKQRDPKGSVIWRCRCDCGKEVDISYNRLMYTAVKSCGCQKKEHEQVLHTYLTHVAGTSMEMLKSKKVPTDNTSGYRGVYLLRGKYAAKIVFQKKAYFLGRFETLESAVEARKEAEELLFDNVAAHYESWKLRAAEDPSWAEANPVKILVEQDVDRKLSVTLLPDLQ